jgi:glyoxylase-like metal-dependent hydrolase (beta-lactamase superfamily II)
MSLYFRQLLAGRDFATRDPIAAQMVNFSYLIGDAETRECLVVDPAWDVEGLVDAAESDGMKVAGALVTHYHPDHIGGDMFGHSVEGLAQLLEIRAVPAHCNKEEAAGVRYMTGLSGSDVVLHDAGDSIAVGNVTIELVHTPGHTPGSQCFLVDGRLVSGDTLFVQGCGRVDLPGGDPAEMYRTLTQRLAKLPATTILYPGHHYGPTPTSTLADERRDNYYLHPRSLEEWLGLMG